MKIGILTFHSQINYGGVLQAFAMQTVLEAMGYDPIVVDRWTQADNWLLTGGYSSYGLKQWIAWGIRLLLGLGVGKQRKRYLRTQRFLATYLKRTPYHFYQWSDLQGQPLGVDGILVGSDQVWNNAWWNAPEVYLLEGAPRISAIAYAASFGMRTLPEEKREIYRRGFQRFTAISVREAEGVKLVAEGGAQATHVLDPTQLVPAQTWIETLNLQTEQKPTLVCYFLSQELEPVRKDLEVFARKHRCKVLVFSEPQLKAMPKSPKALLAYGRKLLSEVCSPIQPCWGQGPREFVRAFAQATYVLSDSFHALMFSSLFNKNVRILRPQNEDRRAMFARIEEFERYASASFISDSVREALTSFETKSPVVFDVAVLEEQREISKAWLKQAIAQMESVKQA